MEVRCREGGSRREPPGGWWWWGGGGDRRGGEEGEIDTQESVHFEPQPADGRSEVARQKLEETVTRLGAWVGHA